MVFISCYPQERNSHEISTSFLPGKVVSLPMSSSLTKKVFFSLLASPRS